MAAIRERDKQAACVLMHLHLTEIEAELKDPDADELRLPDVLGA